MTVRLFEANRLSRLADERAALAVTGIVANSTGLSFEPPWVTAVDAAPVLTSVVPSIAICAVGLGMIFGTKWTYAAARNVASEEPQIPNIARQAPGPEHPGVTDRS